MKQLWWLVSIFGITIFFNACHSPGAPANISITDSFSSNNASNNKQSSPAADTMQTDTATVAIHSQVQQSKVAVMDSMYSDSATMIKKHKKAIRHNSKNQTLLDSIKAQKSLIKK